MRRSVVRHEQPRAFVVTVDEAHERRSAGSFSVGAGVPLRRRHAARPPAKPRSATCDDRVMPELHGREHVERYRATDGGEGHYWREALVLLLTTTGRKSDEKRTTPLLYGRRGDDVVLIASNGGAPAHPPWYLNLKADPEVEVQIKGERFKSRAREATPEERPELWRTMAGYYPPYDEYQRRTEREIPVIVLERVD
jgi:deazaflavin-dependent oxidoreductase (nitroreductase family)